MDNAFLYYILTAGIGFAIGGVIMTAHSLLLGRPLGFALAPTFPALIPLQIGVRLLAGPAILVRNVFSMEDDSISLAVAGVTLALFWSLGCGYLLLGTLGQV